MTPEIMNMYYAHQVNAELGLPAAARPQVTRTDGRPGYGLISAFLAWFRISVLKQKNIFFGKKKIRARSRRCQGWWPGSPLLRTKATTCEALDKSRAAYNKKAEENIYKKYIDHGASHDQYLKFFLPLPVNTNL